MRRAVSLEGESTSGAGKVRRRRVTLVPLELDDVDFSDLYRVLVEDHKLEEIRVLQSVERLTPRQRQCVLLRFWADLSVEETAKTLRVSPATVHTHTNDAFKTLRVALSAKEMER